MKILIISQMYPNRSNPNAGIFIHSQAKHLQRSGCSVRVVSPMPFAPKALWFRNKWRNYGQLPDFDILEGIPVYYPRYLNFPGRLLHGLSCCSMYKGTGRFLDTLVKNFKPGIIHAHTATPGGYPGLRLARKHRLPFVCSLRGSDINTYPYRERLTLALTCEVLRNSNGLTSVSEALKLEAEKLAAPQVPIEVIYNGCDSVFFTCRRALARHRQTLGISKNAKVLLFVGSIEKAKGVYELVSSFNAIYSRHPDIQLIMVGDGPDLAAIKKIAGEGPSRDAIRLPGSIANSEMPEWFGASDLFILPTHYEGLPNALLEAMASGLPVISTRVGGIPEAVRTGETGILVGRRDTAGLIEAMDYLIRNEGPSREMGMAAQKTVRENFTWQGNAKKMIGVYERVLRGCIHEA